MTEIKTPFARLPQPVLGMDCKYYGWEEGRREIAFLFSEAFSAKDKLTQSCDLLAKAKNLCKKGKFAEAIPLLEESLLYYPEQKDANFYLAKIYYQAGNWQEAVKNFAKIPQNNVCFEYIKALKKTGNYTEAYKILQKLDQQQNPTVLIELGKLCHILGKYKEALKYYNQYLKLKPNTQRVFQLKGITENRMAEF